MNISEGEKKAWDILASLTPEDLSRQAGVSFNEESASYVVKSYGLNFTVAVGDRKVSCDSPNGDRLLTELAHFFRPSLVWYLISARDIPCTGRLVNLENIKGGGIFSSGSHVLPLDEVASKYSLDKEAFITRGTELGGDIAVYGDASFRLLPFPRIPIVLTLWLADEEFPARVRILFDSTCEMQLPVDVLWSVAMTSLLLFL